MSLYCSKCKHVTGTGNPHAEHNKEHIGCGGIWYDEKEPSCLSCRFFYQTMSSYESNSSRGWGNCRRYAPKPIGILEKEWQFPEIYDDNWCGEFEEKIHDVKL